MKFLIIQPSPDWGGTEEWIANVAQNWQKRGVEILGVTDYQPLKQTWQKNGIKVIHLPFILDIAGDWKGFIKALTLLPYAFFWYLNLLIRAKRQGVNAAILTGFGEKLLVSWLSRLIKLPIIWFEYPPLKTQFKRNLGLPKLLYQASTHLPQRILTISQNTQKSLIKDAHIPRAKISLVYPGVVIPPPKKITNRPIVGHLSRLAPEKGQRLLLRAWRQVAKTLPHAQLKIAGRGPDSNYLKNLARQLDITGSVEFLGFVNNKHKFYRSLSLFVFPTVWPMEGFGIAAAEALSFGLPTVAFNFGPMPEIITSKVGVLVTPGDAQALSKAIIKLLKHHDLKQALSRNAYQQAKRYFNLDHQAKKIIEIIKLSI